MAVAFSEEPSVVKEEEDSTVATNGTTAANQERDDTKAELVEVKAEAIPSQRKRVKEEAGVTNTRTKIEATYVVPSSETQGKVSKRDKWSVKSTLNRWQVEVRSQVWSISLSLAVGK